MRRFYEGLAVLMAKHPAFAVATIVSVSGSCPRDEGAKMIVFPDGTIEGTLGGGSLEASVIKDALECLQRRVPALKRYDLTDGGLGMKCGGNANVYIEPVAPAERVVVFGGGHVGKAIARLAPVAGFAVEVVDDRSEHLDPGSYPPEVRLTVTDPSFTTGFDPVGSEDFVVVVTREANLDADLAGRYAGAAAYVGVMGSRAKLAFIKKRLVASGMAAAHLDEIRCPMGLDIGSDTPEEIAFSVVGELIALRAARRAGR